VFEKIGEKNVSSLFSQLHVLGVKSYTYYAKIGSGFHYPLKHSDYYTVYGPCDREFRNCVLPEKCIYIFDMNVTINNDYFPKQHRGTVFSMRYKLTF
jgi:hypothetical protein